MKAKSPRGVTRYTCAEQAGLGEREGAFPGRSRNESASLLHESDKAVAGWGKYDGKIMKAKKQ